MKTFSKLLFALALILGSNNLFAQGVSINDGGAAADANAMLDISNTANDKGILIPRLTTAQIAAMGTTDGLIVFNTDIGDLQVYDAGEASWKGVGSVKTNATTAPVVTNDLDEGYRVGSFWTDVTNDKTWICLDPADGAAIWKEITLVGNEAGIYAGSGSLTGATTVTQGANTLDFITSVTDGFSVDGTTFSVDGANNRVGIGTAAPTFTLDMPAASAGARIGVAEVGSWPIINAYAYFGHEALNHALGTDYALLQHSTGATYLNTSSGQDISFREGNGATMTIKTGGNVGIGTTTPHSALQLGNVLSNRRFTLWETVDNDHQFYGFGVNSDILRYQVAATTSKHVFYAGTSSTTSNELMRINGDGNVGIGTAAPSFPLSFGTDLGNKIALYDGGAGTGYGFGIQASLLQIFAGDATRRVGIGYGNSGAFTETLTVKGANVGIGTITPSSALDVIGNVEISGEIQQDGWTSVTFQNSWVDNGGGYAPAAYFKDKQGRVHVRGFVKSGTSANAIVFYLPAGYRPTEKRMFSTVTVTGTAVRMDVVGTDGKVYFVQGGSTAGTSIEFSFRP
jgi:hypothetical protein